MRSVLYHNNSKRLTMKAGNDSAADRKSHDGLLLLRQRLPNSARDCINLAAIVNVPAPHVANSHQRSWGIRQVWCAAVQCPWMANQDIADAQQNGMYIALAGFDGSHSCFTRHPVRANCNFDRTVLSRYGA